MSDVEAVFKRIAAKAPALAQSTAEQRIAKLQRLQTAILDAKDAICDAAYKEIRVTEIDAAAQLMMIKSEIEFICKNLKTWMEPERVKGSLMMLGKKAYIQYEPKGVVLNLSTWNAPIVISFLPAIGAIASGNGVIVKPSELAPFSAQVVADIVAKTFSPDEFAVIQGGPDVAQALLALPFNHIYYTGGQNVGRLVMKAAAENFASVTLEMGGKNPVIVDASAKIADAAKKIMWGRMSNAGQVCVAPDYAIVQRSVLDAFVAGLKEAATAMYNPTGAGFEKSEAFPRMISDNHFERVRGLIEDAVAKGATVALGGQSNAAERYIAPTVLTGVTEDMKILRDEIFGPVLPIVTFDKREEVIDIIRRRQKPLAFYIFATDRSAIDFYLHHSSAGSTVVNHNLIQSGTNPHLAFGGVNHSGMGRIGGHQSFLEFSNPRSVVEETPASNQVPMPYPPSDEKYKTTVRSMLKRNVIMPDYVVRAIEGILKVRAAFAGK